MTSSRKHAGRRQRQLKLQRLERRQLLVAELGDLHNVAMPEDVNADGVVTSVDALMVINRLRRRGNEEAASGQDFRDVNGDGDRTPGALDEMAVDQMLAQIGHA